MPSKRDLSEWTDKKFIFFLNFLLFFLLKSDKTERFSAPRVKRIEAEHFLETPNHPYQEFLYRINQFTFDPNSSDRKFMFKFQTLYRAVLYYLRANPALITAEMKKLMESTPRLKWAMSNTKVITSELGVDVVVADTKDNSSIVSKEMTVPSLEKRMLDALLKTVNVYEMLSTSLTQREIKQMDAKDKLMALARFSPLFNMVKSFRPNVTLFKNLNVHVANKDDLEQQMLDYAKHKSNE